MEEEEYIYTILMNREIPLHSPSKDDNLKPDEDWILVPTVTKKKNAPLSNLEKRVKRIIREAKGVTNDGDPIDKQVLKKFLLEIEESDGFYFSEFPGYIDSEYMPDIYPHQKILDNRYSRPNEYAQILFLATLAVAEYNKDHSTYFKVIEIKHLNVSLFHNYITFSAIEVRGLKKGIFSRLFIRVSYFIIIFLLWCCGPFWRKPLKLIREWSSHVLKANEKDLQDKNIECSTFRALVVDYVFRRKINIEFSQSSLEKRVKNIIRQAEGVTDDGDPIDKEVLKKFVLEIEKSEGFYFSEFPGYIDSEYMPHIYPQQQILDNRYNCPEDYDRYLFLATLAVAKYNKDHSTYYKVVEIEHLNVWIFRKYITFSVIEVRGAKEWLLSRLFFRAFYFIIISSLWCCGFFWRDALYLIRRWTFCFLLANEDDLQDKNVGRRSTFRALVEDYTFLWKRDVVSCKLLKEDS